MKIIIGAFDLRAVSFATVNEVKAMLQTNDPAHEYTVTRDPKGRPLGPTPLSRTVSFWG